MKLINVQISNLRNLHNLKTPLHPNFTIITGKNGSGKTSFLEAIYLLSSGRSFRTREAMDLITFEQQLLTVFGKTDDEQSISIQKSNNKSTLALINNEPCNSSSQLANFLPCQLFYVDIFDFVNAGPTRRRAVLDWGMFHVEPQYNIILKQYRQVLKQKNALFKQRKPASFHKPWDAQLAKYGELLHNMRTNYIDTLAIQFHETLKQLSDINCTLKYEKGWDKKKEGIRLADALSYFYLSDALHQKTQFGPHKADLQFVLEQGKAKQSLSRGQQKTVLFALKLAQVEVIKKECIFLIDDLEAELDNKHMRNIIDYLTKHKYQTILTSQPNGRLSQFINDSLNISLDADLV